MPKNDTTPLIERLNLEKQYSGYESQFAPEELMNVPYRDPESPVPATEEQGSTPSALTAFENKIFSMQTPDGPMTGGSIQRSLAEVSSDRYQNFVPGDYNNEDAYAQGQGWTAKMMNGVGKGLVLTGTTFLQSTVGLVNGVARSMMDGRLASFYDNDFNRAMDEVNKWSENAMPNYYTDAEKNARWYAPSKLFSANFLWDGIVKNLGFAAGAALSGGVFAAGVKGLAALPGLSRLVSIGKGAEALATTEEALLAANAAGKSAETFGKIKQLSDKFLSSYNVLNPGGRAVVAGLATTGEAGFEAFQNLNQFRDEKIQQYREEHNGQDPTGEDLERINRDSDSVGNSSFLANAALLTVTNYVQFPKILGSTYTAEKQIANNVVHQIGEIVEEGGKYAAKKAGNRLLAGLKKVAPYTFSVTEGFEEGAQFAITAGTQDYYDKKYNNEPTSFLESLVAGVTETVTTDEGMENVLIGGLSGAIMLGRGRYKESKEIAKNTAQAIQDFNRFRLTDFTKDTIDAVNRGTILQEQREGAIKSGDVLMTKDLEADYVINYLAPRIKYGRFDLVMSDIQDYKRLATADFSQLQAEGKALETDTKEAYLKRLEMLENTANNMKSLYQSLNLRFGGLVDEKGNRVYSNSVIDKMIYSATKVADYDERIPELASEITSSKLSIDLDKVMTDLIAGDTTSFNEELAKITSSDNIDKDDIAEKFEDFGEMVLRRNLFLKEYNEIKNNPKKYQEQRVEDLPQEQQEPVGEKKTITIKTKNVSDEFEVGTEYYLGKVTDEDEKGHEVYRFPTLTILGENEDGTIKIKTSNGRVRDISKEELADYKLGRVDTLETNKKAKFYKEHANTIYEFNFGKGKKQKGRLEYSPKEGILIFTYKDRKGKTKQIEVTSDQFVARKGYNVPMIRAIGELTPAQQKSLEEFSAEKDERITAKKEARLKIMNDLFDELFTKQEKIKKLIAQKQSEVKNISDELSELEEVIAKGEVDKRIKKGFNFKSSVRSALNNAMRLSRAKEQLEREIEDLEAQQTDLDFTMSYVSDVAQNIDELPTDTTDFMEELKDQLDILKDLSEQTAKEIDVISRVIDKLGSAIDSAMSLLRDLVDEFLNKYPKAPTAMLGQEWIDFLRDNPNFLKLKPDYKSDLSTLETLIAETEDFEIKPNQEKIADLNDKFNELSGTMKELNKEVMALDVIYSRFKQIADEFKKQKEEEKQLQKNKKLINDALGTVDNETVHTTNSDRHYEAVKKKATDILWRATMGVVRGKPHQERANRFGARLSSFKDPLANRDSIKGLVVTSKNQDQILPGLMDLLVGDNTDIDKDDIIALIMVQMIDGKPVLVDEFGKQIDPSDAEKLDKAIFQVFPLKELKWSEEYGGESMFRDNTQDDVKEQVLTEYARLREEMLKNSTDLKNVHEISASFGVPMYDYQLDDEGNPIKGKNDKPLIDYSKRTSVEQAGLVDEDSMEAEQLIYIPKTNENVGKGTTTFVSLLGRPFLELPNAYVPLQNRHHTEKEAESIYQTVLQLAKNMMNKEMGLDHPETKRLLRFLKSVVYWKVPEGEQSAGYNNMFWEKDEKGNFVLSISGKGTTFPFTPSGLEENKTDIVLLLTNMYNNINSLMATKLNEPYEEILSISPDGTIKSRTWKNYQSYLLADKFIANDPEDRNNGVARQDIPLSTIMKPVTETSDVNRTGIYFYTTDNADDVTINESEKKSTKKIIIQPTVKTGGYTFDGKTENTFVSKIGKKLIFTIDDKNNIVIKEKADYNEIFEKAVEYLANKDEAASDEYVIGEDEENKIKYKDKALDLMKQSIMRSVNEASKQPVKEEVEEKEEEETEEDKEGFTVGEDDFNDEGFTFGEDDVDESISRAINDAFSAGSDEELYRQIIDDVKDYEIENWDKTEQWLKTNFPNIPVYRVKNVIQATNGRQAWGMFKDGAIYVYENAEVGTVYHEVFHAVWRMFTDPEEQQRIMDEFKARPGSFVDTKSGNTIKYSEATEDQMEEKLAEELRDYVQNKKMPFKPEKGKPYILKLFSDLVSFIKEFFTGKTADSNTEKLFKQIGEGYYKKHFPYESQLSFARKGIIDVEEAFASNDSEFRLKGISDRERSEIIQHITYMTLVDVIKSDKNLFKTIGENRSDLYARLKDDVLKTIAKKLVAIDTLIKEKRFTKQQLKGEITATKNLMVAVASQWKSIVEKHQEYLKSYSIEFDENDELQINDEDKIKESDYVEANKIDHFKKANSAVKLLLATVPYVDPDDTTKLKRSSIGGAILIPVGQTYVTLMNKLHSATSVEDMLEKLHDIAKDDPNYRTLYKRITKNDWSDEGIDMSKVDNEYAGRIVASIWKTFKKQNPEVKNVYILDNGEVVVGSANLSGAAAQLRDDYVDNIVTKAKTDVEKSYFTFDAKKKMYVGDPKKMKGVNLDSNKAMVSFLNNLGIVFDIKQVNKLRGKDLTLFKDAVSGIKKSIDDGQEIATFSSKVLNIHKRLLELGYIQAKISNPDFDSTFFNINNERTQSFIGTNPASDLYNFISSIPSLTEENLVGTQYAYLTKTGDVFASGSNILERMFTSKGTRKKDKEAEGLLTVAYVGGTDNQPKGKQKQSSKLNYKERLVQEMNLNLAGYYLNLVPGDASMEWAIYMGNPIQTDSLERGYADINSIFKKYFISELKLAREQRPVAKGRNANEMRFFKSILGDSLHKEIISSDESVEKVYNDFESRINSALRKFINNNNESFKKLLESYNILNETEKEWSFENVSLPKNISEKTLNNYMTFFTVNFMIANIELHKLLYADPYQYSDELKRIKNFNSPRQALINNSPKMNAVLNKIWNKNFKEGEIGWTNFTSDQFRSITLGDVNGIINLPGYSDYTETDGAGIITMNAYRQFKIRIGEWTDAEEAQYQFDMQYEKMVKGDASIEEIKEFKKTNPAVKSAYTPIKPIVSGNKANEKNYNDILLDKFALYPVSFRLLQDLNEAGGKNNSNMISLYNKMTDEKIDYAVFESGRKVGATAPFNLYNEKGEFNTNPFDTKAMINVPFAIMSVQSEVPSKESHQVTRGSQVTKLVTLDYMEAGVPIDFAKDEKTFEKRYERWNSLNDDQKKTQSELYKEIKNNQDILEALMEVGYQNLLARLGIAEEKGKYLIVDYSQVASTLREEVLKRETNDNISDAITAFESGKAILEATPAYHQIRNILYSIADKEVISPKINGGMKVQVPSTLLEEVRAEKTTINGKTGYTSEALEFYKKDGKQVCEIMIGRWFESDMSDAELLKYLNETEEGKKILSGLGFRIPTQKQNSIDSFVIKQFLPKEFGDSIIIPAALVAKAGSDFDIDKLIVYLKNVINTKKGVKIITLKDDTNSTTRQRYNTWVKNIGNLTIQNYIRLLSRDEITKLRDDFKQRFGEIKNRYKESLETISEEQYNNLITRYRTINDEIKTSQNEEIVNLFQLGKVIFNELPKEYKDVFFQMKDYITSNDINGPQEIELYLSLVNRILDEREVGAEIEKRLADMASIYEQELRILGSTQERINQLKADALVEFRETKSNEITDLQLTSLLEKRALGEIVSVEQSDFENSVIDEIAKLAKLMSYEDFSKQPILLQNNRAALENEYIESCQKLVSHPMNFERLIKPNSAKQLSDLSKEIARLTVGSTFDYKDVGNMLNREFMSRLRHAFVTGKYAIGIAAVNQTNHSLNQRQRIYIDPQRLGMVTKEDRFWLKDGDVRFENFNRIKVGNRILPTLSMIKNAVGQDISDIIAQFIDGYVDISKGPWIMELGATPNVASTWLFLVKLGVPIDDVAYFMNQPIIRQYLKTIESAGYSWLFMDNFVEDVMEEYQPSGSVGMPVRIPSLGKLKTTVNKSADKMDNAEKAAQQMMLKEFLKYAKIAEHMFHVTQGSNFDTAMFNDPYLVFKKFTQLQKASTTIISDVNDLLANSFVGNLAITIKKLRDSLSEILVSDKSNVRSIIENVLSSYIEMNDKDFIRLSQKAVNDLFDYAVQTDQKLNAYIKDILVNDGGVGREVMEFVNAVKNDPKHPLYSNHVINIIQSVPSKKAENTGVNNIKVRGLGNKVYDQNNIIYAFREIRNYLKGKSKLYDRIVQLAILQNGLSSSVMSFTSVLPFEDFEKIYNKTLSKIESIPNLDNFVKLSVFQRNNWNNDDIVPHMSAPLIRSKKTGDPYYNPAMEFLDKKVKRAISDGIIPQVMTVRTTSREARKDHLVYTWEKFDELITSEWKSKYPGLKKYELIKQIKADMRKAGDYSYINKGLFEKVKDGAGGYLTTFYKNSEGEVIEQYIYKMINAWGDGHRANEFYDVDKPSVIDNGFLKAKNVDNNVIIGIFKNEKLQNQSKAISPKQSVSQEQEEDDGIPRTDKQRIELTGYISNLQLMNDGNMEITIPWWLGKLVEQGEDMTKDIFNKMIDSLLVNKFIKKDAGPMLEAVREIANEWFDKNLPDDKTNNWQNEDNNCPIPF